MTSVQHIFFKLSIKDIHEAKYNSSKECFQCYLDRAEPKLSLNFKKVRICGSICEFSDNYFYVDDGTATIKVIYSEDNLETDETQLQLGDYVEILGNDADSPLEIWKHLAVKLAFNCLSTGTMAAMGRVAGNWMSWVSISNKKLIDRGIRLLVELGGVSYEEAAQRIFAAEEWVQAQDWTGKEEPCAVQVALAQLREGK